MPSLEYGIDIAAQPKESPASRVLGQHAASVAPRGHCITHPAVVDGSGLLGGRLGVRHAEHAWHHHVR